MESKVTITIEKLYTTCDGQEYFSHSIKGIGISRTEILGRLEVIKNEILKDLDKSTPELLQKIKLDIKV